MLHEYGIQDQDVCFVIDPNSRTITKESGSYDDVVQYDHNSERFTFKIPKIVDGHDMRSCDSIEIHYINTSTGTSASVRNSNGDIYLVDDADIDPDDSNTVKFTWLLSQNGTQYAGMITFQIHFKCYADENSGVVDYVWNTRVYSAINVLAGIDCTELVLEQSPDIIQQFESRLASMNDRVDVMMKIKHAHPNQDVIDKFTEEDGVPMYDGNAISRKGDPIEIPDSSITTEKLENDSVTNEKIADGAITGVKIADGAIDTKQIADNSIDGLHIKENSIGDGHIYPSSILTDKIADKAVTPEKLDRTYATEEYVDNAVANIDFPETDSEVADDSIGTEKLKDGAVTPDKLSEKYLKDDVVIPTTLSELADDSEHRLVTDEEKVEVKKIASAFDFNFNLFDKSTATAGSYIDGTEIKSNAAYCVSAYIEIKPLTYYIVPSILNNLGSEFDENKAFLQKITRSDISQPDSDKTLIYTGSKAKYIRVNIFVGPGTPENVRDINTFMVLEGTEYPETFIPHNGLKPILKPGCIIDDEEATDTGEIEKVINAFDFNFNLFDKDAATVGSYAVRENIVNNSSYYVSDYIEVKPLTYYVVPNTASQVGSCFDENKTYLGQLKRSAMSQPYSDKTIIFTTATTKYIRVNGFSGVASAYVTCPINEYMVIEGQTYPVNYIPYNGLKPLIKSDCIPENKELVDKVNRSNILYGKTLMTIGDSITRGLMIDVSEETGYEMTYGGLTAYRNNMTFINTGWSGGTIANDNVKPFINDGAINVALGDITPDYLTIWYGWNDYTRDAITLGDINSTDETTYYGAWNIALNLLINKYPTTKIGVVVPYGMNAEWRQAVRNVAKKWGVPYLDLYENQSCIFDNESGVESSIAELRKATFLADHCHPNSAGYEWLSTIYEAFLRRL